MLFLAADFPLPAASGSQIRQMNLIKSFSTRFDITLIALSMQESDQQHAAELEQYVSQVVRVLPANKRSVAHRLFYKVLFALRRLFLGDSKDRFYNAMPNITQSVVTALKAQQYDVLFTIYWYWDAKIWDTTARKVIDANDVQSHRVERLLERSRNPFDRLMHGFLVKRYRQMEAAALRKADLIVAITERDRREFEEMTGGTVPQIVIPTGVDTDWFVPEASPEPHQVAFFGALRNPMNRDAVAYLLDEVWPALRSAMPQLSLILIGAGAPADMQALVKATAGVSMTGYVEDIRRPLGAAQMVLLPLRIGWGIRGRVYEVMSLGVPVIATPVAIEGMGLHDGDGLLLASSPEEFVSAVRSIVEDPLLRQRLGEKGRQIAVQTASFQATYDRLAEDLAGRWEQKWTSWWSRTRPGWPSSTALKPHQLRHIQAASENLCCHIRNIIRVHSGVLQSRFPAVCCSSIHSTYGRLKSLAPSSLDKRRSRNILFRS